MSDQIKADWPALQDFSQDQPNWIDYGEAEAALFAALRPELRLIALDHAHQFGAAVVEMVDDVAAAAYTKASNILHEQGTRRAFGDKHLLALLTRWAAWWCEHFAARQRSKAARADVCARSAAERRAYTLAKYGGPDAEKVGQQGSLRKRQASARPPLRYSAPLWLDYGEDRRSVQHIDQDRAKAL